LITEKRNENNQIAWPWLILGISLMTLLTWFNGQPEAVGLVHEPWDKVAHSLIFVSLTLSFGLSVGVKRRYPVLFLMLAFAAFDEVRQLFLPGRSASIGDFAVDVMAIMTTLWLILPWLQDKWERRG